MSTIRDVSYKPEEHWQYIKEDYSFFKVLNTWPPKEHKKIKDAILPLTGKVWDPECFRTIKNKTKQQEYAGLFCKKK